MSTVHTITERGRAPRLRADASRNRERIVAAAREAFVEYGAEATLDQIARRAGVGNATMYRHFADRAELSRQVMLEVMNRVVRLAESALDEADAFEALRRFVHGAAAEQVGALCPVVSGEWEAIAAELAENRARLQRAVQALMDRARDEGLLREDVAPGDIMIAICQLTRPLPSTGCLRLGRFAERHLDIFLDGLRAPARSVLPGPGATFEDLQPHP
ncbi:helix-turn-helix domain-containing protein [Sphaerisporangium sp. B11E5]|uniref:TetR/AcrR family transcriptional regulator n=1 Tax=Sphaerisporangium sp. B11E5 TaxID=3153563 RepID=UPI00325E787C